MLLSSSDPNNGRRETNTASEPDLHFTSKDYETHRLSEDIDSTCSTPYVSAPSSPGRGSTAPSGYFFSAPASPMHFVLSTASSLSSDSIMLPTESKLNSSGSFEFEFSSRFSPTGSTGKGSSMCSADELFLNGQIRPMKLSSHLERPQILVPLIDLEDEEEESNLKSSDSLTRGRDLRLRNRSLHRKARSLSPLRNNAEFQWRGEKNSREEREILELENAETEKAEQSVETTPSDSVSSSRSSSSGRNSKKWIFLKDLLYRSKSEGSRGVNKEKFWSTISFSPSKEKKLSSPTLTPSSSREDKEKGNAETQKQKRVKKVQAKKSGGGKPANGVSKRRVPPSAHELHYTANRAQAEEMKKKTFLPYRQGLLGCLGFSSKGYGAFNGFTTRLNPVSSR